MLSLNPLKQTPDRWGSIKIRGLGHVGDGSVILHGVDQPEHLRAALLMTPGEIEDFGDFVCRRWRGDVRTPFRLSLDSQGHSNQWFEMRARDLPEFHVIIDALASEAFADMKISEVIQAVLSET